jgi:hypothetical protein
LNGGDAVRNRCAECTSLVFGGEIGKSDSYTIYASALDDPSGFDPTFAIFAEGRLDWAIIPPGFKIFDRMRGSESRSDHCDCPRLLADLRSSDLRTPA